MIESPSLNSRRITASIVIDSSLDDVWSILTDYNNLSKHVPNLVQSYLVPNPEGKIRLFQEGAQRIIGFDFRASLTMDMTEEKEDEGKALREKKLTFKLLTSRMFDSFDGAWTLRYHSRSREYDPKTQRYTVKYKTKLTYSVYVRPKGPVPVIALEWRIREDIPINLEAVKMASEKVLEAKRRDGGDDSDIDVDNDPDSAWSERGRQSQWEADETLGTYIGSSKSIAVMNRNDSYDTNNSKGKNKRLSLF